MYSENNTTNSETETFELAREFAKILKPSDVVLFYGDLGSGKTEFIKGICEYFKVEDIVSSPTFTIMNKYIGKYKDEEIPLFHIDLYRIDNKKELREIGFEECVYEENSIKLIEWADKANRSVPKSSYSVKIITDEESENKRKINISESAGVLN